MAAFDERRFAILFALLLEVPALPVQTGGATHPIDAILGRVQAAGLEYHADPVHRPGGELSDNDGGNGFYVHDPDGHNLAFLTRPITG